jgi:hypothetical protein
MALPGIAQRIPALRGLVAKFAAKGLSGEKALQKGVGAKHASPLRVF